MLPACCDIAIFGAGAAGISTALALRRHSPELTIVLLDAGVRQRSMGTEVLAREAHSALDQLDVWEHFLAADTPTTEGTWAAWGDSELHPYRFFFAPERQGWRVTSDNFRATLLAAARDRGIFFKARARLLDIASRNRGWSLALGADGEAATLTARFLVDATGRQAHIARRQGANKVRFDRLVGAFVVFSIRSNLWSADVDALVEAHEHGFWYSAQGHDGSVVAAFMTDADIARMQSIGEEETWSRLFRSSKTYEYWRQHSPGWDMDSPPIIHALDSHRLDHVVGDGWLAVGDAAASADFLSSQGLRQALDAGIRAAEAIGDTLAGRLTRQHRFQRGLIRRFEDSLEGRRTIYAREGRWPEAEFWKRRQDRGILGRDQLLVFHDSPTHQARLEGLGMYMPVEDLRLLASLCTAPRLVHAVVEAFKKCSKEPPSDRRILSTLQFLTNQGLMTAE